MSEFSRQDFLPDDLLKAPLQFADNWKEVAKSLESIKSIAVDVEKSLKGASTITGMSKATEDLGKAQFELYKVQTLVIESNKEKTAQEKEIEKIEKQIATVTAKNTEEYRKQVTVLDKAKKDLKEKIALGERDAKVINRQNASIDELRSALTKNRQAYRSLATEEQRASKEGKELLRIIQDQDAAVKELSSDMGQHQDNVGNYAEATAALDNQVGGLIGRFKDLASQLRALAASPYFLAIAGLVLVFKALQSAGSTYYSTSLEGEEALARRRASLDAFFTSLKRQWAEVGKAADDAVGANGVWSTALAALAARLGILSKYIDLEQKAIALAETDRQVLRLRLKEIVNGALDEVKLNELLEESRNKLRVSDEDRLNALREARDVMKDIFQGDTEQLNLLIKQQEDVIKADGGRIIQGKLISELTEEELKQMNVKGEMIEHLAELQAELINKEAEYVAKRTSLSKLEIQLVNEIDQARRQSAQRIQDAELSKQRQTNERIIEFNRDRLENESLSTDERIDIIQRTGAEELEVLRKQKEAEFNLITRAAEDVNREEAQIRANAQTEGKDLSINETLRIQDEFLKELLANDEAYQLQKAELDARYRSMERDQTDKNTQEIVAAKRQEIESLLEEAKFGLDKSIAIIKQEVIDGKKTRAQGDKEILEQKKKANIAFIVESIKAMEKILQIENLPLNEAKKIQKEIEKLKLNLIDALLPEDSVPHILDILNKIQDAFTNFAGSLNDLFSSLTERRLQEIDLLREKNSKRMEDELAEHERQANVDTIIEEDRIKRQEDLYKEQLDNGLQAAGDDLLQKEELQRQYDENINALTQARVDFELNKESEKAAIQNEFARKDLEYRRKAANAERQAAVFAKATGAIQAAINTAVAVTELGVVTPLAIAAGIAGAIQVAAILAKPIPPVPQFFAGGTVEKTGSIIAGELGTELMKYPSGAMSFTPDKATLLKNIPVGTKILSHEDTMQFLSMAALSGLKTSDIVSTDRNNTEWIQFSKKIDSLERAIRTKKEVHVNFSRRGAEASIKNAETRTKLFNDLFR
jgi:hypothetical protein